MFADWGESGPIASQPQSSAPSMQVVNVMADAHAPAVKYPQQQQQSDAILYGSAPAEALYGNGGNTNAHLLTKHVGDYVQNMTQDLISNMEYLTDKTPVGVTNFALIDSNLKRTNLLGYQLAESFIHELHKFRIPVIDFKATEYIRVTEHGDYLLTRDFLELTDKAPIEYILTGTLTKHQGGYLVNARILGLKSKAVVATAQMLMPFYIVDALLPSEHSLVDGVKLTQGE
jgi:TolB-like protein